MSLEAQQVETLSLLSKVSSKLTDRVLDLEKSIGNTIGMAAKTANNKPEKAVSNVLGMQANLGKKGPEPIVKKAAPVIVTDFGKKAEQDLGRLGGDPGQGGQGGEAGEGKGGLGKLTAAALLVLGGVAALVTGLMSDGPLKGFLKILAKGGIIGGIKLFAATAGKSLKKFGKLFAKILPKNLFKNVVTTAKGFLSKIGKFLLAPFAKLAGKGGAKALFGTIGKLFFKFLKPVLKRIPGIGSLISWGFAISRFKKGDIVGGLIDVASGIATLFPGIGTGISIGLDVLNAFLDVKKGKEDGVKPEGAPGGIGAFFGKIKDKIMNNFPIKNLFEFWTGVGKVFKGDFKEGFKQMALALPFMKTLSNFLFSEREEVDPETGEVTKKKSIFQAMKEGMIEKFKGLYKKMPKWMKYLAEKVLPKSVISQLEGGETDIFEDAAEQRAHDMEKIQEQIDEEKARINRSKAGENEYFGLENVGMANSMQKIQQLEKELAARQDGGSVNRNTPYMVGEAGPELFIPKNSGDLVDNKTVNILENTLDRKTFVDVTNMNMKISNLQFAELKKNNMLLQAILEKSNSGNTVINNKSSSVVNNQSRSGFRDMQFAV